MILNKKDILKMSAEEKKAKIQDLRFSLIKANVTANKNSSKTKEIKRTLARLLTFRTNQKETAKT